METFYPNSFKLNDFVSHTTSLLNNKEFNKDNSIMVLSLCRDDNTTILRDSLNEVWGNSFDISGLGGYVISGKTSFLAAQHHSPQDENNLERYIFFGFTHIGINEEGEFGECDREGRIAKGTCCGALAGITKEFNDSLKDESADNLFSIEENDIEYGVLRQEIYNRICQTPELIFNEEEVSIYDITNITSEIIKEKLETISNATINMDDDNYSNYAILSGTQIHAPNNEIWIHCDQEMIYGEKRGKEFKKEVISVY